MTRKTEDTPEARSTFVVVGRGDEGAGDQGLAAADIACEEEDAAGHAWGQCDGRQS